MPLTLTRLGAVLAACLALVPARGESVEKKGGDAAELITPKDGAVVAPVEEFEGRLTKGWPVVLVRPLVDGEPWWVQPAVEEVVDGQFTGRAHFGDRDTPKGTKFALVVLIVKDQAAAEKFKPGKTYNVLPDDLPRSRPITLARDAWPEKRPSPGPRVVRFGEQLWHVKVGDRLGPGPNAFSDSPENVWLDDRGHLHLAITEAAGRWRCAEVTCHRSLGHGEYRWVISGNLPGLDRRAILGLFMYESASREIDFELARWGKAAGLNAQFVVQPYRVKGNLHRFDAGKAKVLTVSIRWARDEVRCRCWEGEDTGQSPLADWMYRGRHVPPPGKERPRANLWLMEGKPPASGARQEVVIRSFAFTPGEDAKGR